MDLSISLTPDRAALAESATSRVPLWPGLSYHSYLNAGIPLNPIPLVSRSFPRAANRLPAG